MDSLTTGSIESRKDYKKDHRDQYRYWHTELESAKKLLRAWHNEGTKIVTRFLGGNRQSRDQASPDERSGNFRLNLFHSNVITLQSMLYGNLPKVKVSRRYDDPNDDTGRVAALILERLLNNDVQDNGKEYNSVLRAVLQDRLLPGMGCARVRYTMETEKVVSQGPVGMIESEQLLDEDAPIDYYHWRDVLWGWSRTFSDIPWIGFRSYLTKDEVEERFGEKAADGVHLKAQTTVDSKQAEPSDTDAEGPWRKAEIWEIWDKTSRSIVWMSPGYDKILETKKDPLGLSGFFPCPPFLLANQTTNLYRPTSDFYLAQDLYNEIDTLQTRISIITEAVKVVGVYDRAAEGISRMFKEGTDNDLIPVDNWALFAEKGGIQGQIDWVPIKEIVEALTRLRELRDENIGLLQQITGMSDIMRGQLSSPYEGVGQSDLKAKFGSVRIQALQDEFAVFASDLLQIKAEIIGLHFDAESIAKFANLDETFDRDLVPQAIELLKNPKEARMRVEIRPESVAMVDYAQLKQERTEYITALATFMQSAAPLMEADPNAKPFLLQLLQWGLAGFKGANEIEGVVDKAISASEKEAQQDKPDPEQQRSQMQQQIEQMKHQFAMQQIQAKAAADEQVRQMDSQADLAKIQADLQADLQQIAAKMKADIQYELTQSMINAEQQAAATQGEIQKETVKTALEIQKMGEQAKVDKESNSE